MSRLEYQLCAPPLGERAKEVAPSQERASDERREAVWKFGLAGFLWLTFALAAKLVELNAKTNASRWVERLRQAAPDRVADNRAERDGDCAGHVWSVLARRIWKCRGCAGSGGDGACDRMPRAFALATPLAVTAALGATSRRGVIINDRRILETLGRVNRVVLDQTGTMTEGRLKLLGCELGGRLSFYNALRVALAISGILNPTLAAAAMALSSL